MTLPVYFSLIVFGVNIGLHRGFTHGLLTSSILANDLLLFLGTLTCLGKPSHWRAVHLVHHQYSDTPNDPHSPKYQGFWSVFFNLWDIKGRMPVRKIIGQMRDYRKTHFDFFDKNYFPLIIFTYLVIFLFTGFSWVKFAYIISMPTALCVLATSLVNGVCHRRGEAVDSFLVTLLTLGEGLHHQHHMHPKKMDYTQGLYVDLTGKVLKVLRR